MDRHRFHFRLSVGLILMLALGGCTVGPNYKRPKVEVPPNYRAATVPEDQPPLVDTKWWDLFKDPQLIGLIRTALDHNKDLRLAFARVDAGRAQLGIVGAGRYPWLSAGASGTSTLGSETGARPVPPGADRTAHLYRVGFAFAWEIDLWGKYRRATEAARAEMLAADEVRQAVAISVVTNVAQAYLQLRELDLELQITNNTLTTRKETARIVGSLYRNGLSNELDFRQAEGAVAATAAALPDIERGIGQAENALSILLGQYPGPIARGFQLDDFTVPPEVPAGLPSSLIERRPDIRSAEQILIASNAQIGVAKAAYFPAITLTGPFGTESTQISGLFSSGSGFYQFPLKIAQPIFTAGAIKSSVKMAESMRQQALIQYEQAIQQAFREVEDSLIAHRKAREALGQQQAYVAAYRRASQVAESRFKSGLSNFLPVLDSQRELYSAELGEARIKLARVVTVTQLYKALGGGY
jgi:outer membrane protein, multidrug efflux system